MDSINEYMRNQTELLYFITRKKWIPSRKTIIRLCDELKEKPYMWKRNRLIPREVRITVVSHPYRSEFVLTYSPANHIDARYVMRIRTDDGGGRIYNNIFGFRDRDTESIYQTIREQITGGWE